jgi:hypothetical protein
MPPYGLRRREYVCLPTPTPLINYPLADKHINLP